MIQYELNGPHAVDQSVLLGNGCVVWQFTTICRGTVVGDGTVIGANVWIGKDCRIGKNCRIQTGVFLPNGSVIEDDVFIGPLACFTDDRHPRVGNKEYRAEPPVVKKGAAIGAGATILPGVVIGEGAMVAAGAVVTRDVSAGGLMVGRPAQLKVA